MIAFRIADRRHPIFDPTGARLKGGRWNSPGRGAIYAAQTFAGALLEVLVHQNLGEVPSTHAVVRIDIPDDLKTESIETDWAMTDLIRTREFGDRWLEEQRTAVLLVPSVVLRGLEKNIVLNPNHLDFQSIKVTAPEPVVWDPRLFRSR
jgi:RES domain-containing protein